MDVLVPIGDFSRMTYLSVKALRHYHEVGLLEPARIDPASGYRLYETSQVATAQVIRRFRNLGMPLAAVRAVLEAPDVTSRNEVIVAHLRQMESQLEATQANVASLRALLERPTAPISVEYRLVPPTRSLAIRERVAMGDIEGWWSAAFDELYASLRASGTPPAGPGAALYPNEFFELELGEVVVFVPIVDDTTPSGRTALVDIPAAELAVTVHRGAFSELDQTYGALGTFVAERELGVDGPIREYYVVTSPEEPDESEHRTEVCWPVFHTATAPSPSSLPGSVTSTTSEGPGPSLADPEEDEFDIAAPPG
jgi:DNA-binding transcriptional MerR regulator